MIEQRQQVAAALSNPPRLRAASKCTSGAIPLAAPGDTAAIAAASAPPGSGQPKRRRSSAEENATADRVLAHISQDVRELQGDTEVVRKLAGPLVRLAEHR